MARVLIHSDTARTEPRVWLHPEWMAANSELGHIIGELGIAVADDRPSVLAGRIHRTTAAPKLYGLETEMLLCIFLCCCCICEPVFRCRA
jgi:hypothetical protein